MKRIFWRPWIVVALGVCAASPGAIGQDQAGAELAALQQKEESSKLGYVETYRKLKPEYEALAARRAGTEVGLAARLWLLENTWWLRKKGTMYTEAARILDDILAHYPRSKQLWKLGELHYVIERKNRKAVFEKVLSTSPVEAVKASMLFALAREHYRGRKPGDASRARAYLATLKAKYGDLRYRHTTYGAMAEAYLNPHDPGSLKIGQPAPEIVGTDVNGKPMKLSDFRGKVVVLDFWGFW